MKRLILAVSAVVLVLMSCNTNYQKSKSGMEYKIFSGKASGYNKNAPKEIKPGNVVKFHMEFSVERKGKSDTLIGETYSTMPQYMPFDTSSQILLSPYEPLLYAKAGDSIEYRISIDSLISKQLVAPNDPVFSAGGFVKGKMSVLDVFTTEDSAKADFDKEVKLFEQKEEARKKTAIVDETKAVEKYISDNKFKATKTPKGAFVQIEREGSGPKLDSGKVAVVKYKGYTFDGTVFDHNMDTTGGKSTQPLEVLIGSGQSIEGFEDGLKSFSKGSKGKIFIPATLGYGKRAMPGLAANSNLVFDIEVLDVKDAPATSANNTPQLTPEQMQALQEQMQQQQQQGSAQPGHEGHNHP